jgi:hypothetical protein
MKTFKVKIGERLHLIIAKNKDEARLVLVWLASQNPGKRKSNGNQ